MSKYSTKIASKPHREKFDKALDHFLSKAYDDGYNKGVADMMKHINPLFDAASVVTRGVDWNNGTHAQLYRQKLIDAVEQFRKVMDG